MVNIILDTDISSDCDDVAAIALLNYFKNRNHAEILAGLFPEGVPAWVSEAVEAIHKTIQEQFISFSLPSLFVGFLHGTKLVITSRSSR